MLNRTVHCSDAFGHKKMLSNVLLPLWNKLSELTDGLSRKCSVIKPCSKQVVQPGVTDWSIQRALISYPRPNY